MGFKGPLPTPEMGAESEEIWARMAITAANYERSGIGQHTAEIISELPEFLSFRKMLDLGGGPGLIGISIVAANTRRKSLHKYEPKLMKDFNKLLERARRVLGHFFDESNIDQMLLYPGGWVSEFVEGDGENFDLGLNVIECGIKSSLRFSGQESWKNAWYFL